MHIRNIRKSMIVVPALAALAALALACGSGGTAVKHGAPAATGAAAPAATAKAANGPKAFKLGETATVTRDGADVATVTLANAKIMNDYEGKPAIVVTVTVKALPNMAGTFSFNEFDFDARAADGTTLDPAVVDDVAELHSGDLAAGQTAKGAILFTLGSASQHGVTITYAPGFDTLAYWTVA